MEHLRLTEFRMFNDTSLPKFFKKKIKKFYRSYSISESQDRTSIFFENSNSGTDVTCPLNFDVNYVNYVIDSVLTILHSLFTRARCRGFILSEAIE